MGSVQTPGYIVHRMVRGPMFKSSGTALDFQGKQAFKFYCNTCNKYNNKGQSLASLNQIL